MRVYVTQDCRWRRLRPRRPLSSTSLGRLAAMVFCGQNLFLPSIARLHGVRYLGRPSDLVKDLRKHRMSCSAQEEGGCIEVGQETQQEAQALQAPSSPLRGREQEPLANVEHTLRDDLSWFVLGSRALICVCNHRGTAMA